MRKRGWRGAGENEHEGARDQIRKGARTSRKKFVLGSEVRGGGGAVGSPFRKRCIREEKQKSLKESRNGGEGKELRSSSAGENGTKAKFAKVFQIHREAYDRWMLR